MYLVNYMTAQSADGLPLNFVTPNAPTGTVDQLYSGAVYASGGVPNYNFTITSGALPDGLSLNLLRRSDQRHADDGRVVLLHRAGG